MKLADKILSTLKISKNQSQVSGQGTLTKFGITFPQVAEIDFETLNDIANKDDDIAIASNAIAEAVTGPGYEIVVDGTDENGKPLTDEQKEIIKRPLRQFDTDNGADQLLFETVKEFVTIGVSFTEKIRDGQGNLAKIERLPIESGWQVELPKNTGGPQFVKAIQPSTGTEFTPERLILWRYGRTSAGDWFGRGMAHYFAQTKTYKVKVNGETKTRVVPSLANITWSLEDDLRLIAANMPPKTFVNVPDADDSWVEKNGPKIKDMNGGEQVLMNVKKLEVITAQADPRARLEALLDFYDQKKMRICQVPSAAMFSKEGYSGIFGEQVIKQYNRKIASIKRYVGRTYEAEVYGSLLGQKNNRTIMIENGIDPRKIRVHLEWRPEIIPIQQLQDYVALVQLKTADGKAVLSTEEFRHILKTLFKAPIPDTEPAKAVQATKAEEREVEARQR